MKLRVDSRCWGGIDPDVPDTAPREPHVRIMDTETRVQVVDRRFHDAVEATLFLVAMRPELEKRGLPPMTPEDEEEIIEQWRAIQWLLDTFEAGKAIDFDLPSFVYRAARQPHSAHLEALIAPDRGRIEALLLKHG